MTGDFENDLLLVIAATGKQATGMLPHLIKKWKRLRLNASNAASKEKLQKQYPNAEVTQCDTSDAHACKKLLEGVTACYLVTPGFHPHEVECGCNVIDAAFAQMKAGGPFEHMLHSSVIFPVLRKLINHDNKRYVEEYLVESGLPYTIIQPTHIMETFNLASVIDQDQPVHPTLWDPRTPFSFVSARDIGEAAARIFEQREKHFYATYQLVGTPEPLNYNQVDRIVSEEIGKEVKHEQKSVEEGVQLLGSMYSDGEPNFITKQGAARLIVYYNDKGLVGNPNVLEMLLGRKPLAYREWVKMNVKDLREQRK